MPTSSKTESKTIHSGRPTHNQAEITANNFGQDECPDSQMNGQEPYPEDSLELSASPQLLLTNCEMPSSNTSVYNESRRYSMVDPNCPSSKYPIGSTPNQITELTSQAVVLQCDQTLSAFTEKPKFPETDGQEHNAQQQSFPVRGPDFVRFEPITEDEMNNSGKEKILQHKEQHL